MIGLTEYIRKIGNYAFVVGIVFETLFVLLDKSSYIIQHETWAFRITFLLFACKIACTKYTKREWAVMIAMIGIGVMSYFATDREEVIRMVALIVACKDINIRAVMKLIFFETLIGCLVIMGLSFMGIGGEVAITDMFRGGGIEETRYCFGMGHPNAFHCMFMVVLMLALALFDAHIRWYGYVGAMVLNIIVFLFTDSRTSLLITTVTIALAVVLHYATTMRSKCYVYRLAILLVVACVVFSVFISIVGVSIPILRQIDIRINGRFQWARTNGAIEYWTLFSTPENENVFDMGYVKMFYRYGVVPAIAYLLLLCVTLRQAVKRGFYEAFLMIMTFVMYTLIEAHAVSPYIGRNLPLIYIGYLLGTLQKEDENGYHIFDIGKVGITAWNRIFK